MNTKQTDMSLWFYLPCKKTMCFFFTISNHITYDFKENQITIKRSCMAKKFCHSVLCFSSKNHQMINITYAKWAIMTDKICHLYVKAADLLLANHNRSWVETKQRRLLKGSRETKEIQSERLKRLNGRH